MSHESITWQILDSIWLYLLSEVLSLIFVFFPFNLNIGCKTCFQIPYLNSAHTFKKTQMYGLKKVAGFSGSGRTIFITLIFTKDQDNIQDGRLNICCSSKTVSTTPKDQDKITNGRLAIVYFLNINRNKMNYGS